MLKQTNKHRMERNMEELYNLPSLQKAADLQVLHMCRKSKLTHDGPSEKTVTLAGRLKEFDFIGLNIGENIAKQENDDYREVVKLWMRSAEHRNNILGDYVYSGVATCVGKDGNRYWAQVFGKDISNTKIAKIRDGLEPQGSSCGEDGDNRRRNRDEKENHGWDKDMASPDGSQNGTDEKEGSRESKDMLRPENRNNSYSGYHPGSDSGTSQGKDYIMLVRLPEYKDETEGPRARVLRPSEKDQKKVDSKYIRDFLDSGDGMNYNIRQRGMLNPSPKEEQNLDWRFVRRNRPIAGKSHGQRIKDMNENEAMWREIENSGLLSFGDYLLSSAPRDEGNQSPGISIQKASSTPSSSSTSESLRDQRSYRAVTSAVPIISFVMKNPNNSAVLPAIQSLVDIIKQNEQSQNPSEKDSTIPTSANKNSTLSLTMLSSTAQIASSSISSSSSSGSDGGQSSTTPGISVLPKSMGQGVITSAPGAGDSVSPATMTTISSLVMTKTMTTTVYKEQSSSISSSSGSSSAVKTSSVQSRSELSTPHADPHERIVTTTVYLEAHQKPPVAASGDSLGQKSPEGIGSSALIQQLLNQEGLRSAILRLLNPADGKAIIKPSKDAKEAIMDINKKADNQNESQIESHENDSHSDGKDLPGQLLRIGIRSHRSDGKACLNGYSDNGSCIPAKAPEDAKLKKMLEELIQNGKLHFHISPIEQECSEDGMCPQKEGSIDIGIPFSYKP